MLAIFTYGFEIADTNFKSANIDLTTLSNYSHLLEQALTDSYISEDEVATLSEWRKSPSTWNQ